jgi:hypothetical protein
VTKLERRSLRPETLGLTLSEAKELLREVQRAMVTHQTIGYVTQQIPCSKCGKIASALCRRSARKQSSALVDLNTLIPSNSGFTITDAIGINDSGQILCNATNSSNVPRAVLLSPK